MNRQRGFAGQAIVIILIVLVVVMGASYYSLTRRDSQNDQPSIVSSGVNQPAEPDGTPESVVNATSRQLAEEVAKEVDTLNAEGQEAELDTQAIEDLQGAVDEANL